MRRIRQAAIVCVTVWCAAPAGAAGPFDGVYKGEVETIRSNNSAACRSVREAATVRVVDGRFTRNWGNPRQAIDVEVKPDGTVYGVTAANPGTTSGRRTAREFVVQGRISGGVLVAEIGSSLCAAKMTLKKD